METVNGVGGSASSEEQKKDWVSGETYEIGDYIYHEGEIYRCLTSNNDVDFDEANWKQLTYGIDELSKEDVEGLLSLTEEELETMTNLIADTEIRIDKNYSSSKIYLDIQQCLEDSKTYTLLELSKFSGVGYKIVASTSEMTSESTIYLLANGNTYDMYIVEENGAITKIGDMDVNLDNYFTKTEIDYDFLKKVDADGNYATFTTMDGKVDKDKIVTALIDSVTDKQVASALLTKTEFDKINESISTVNTNLGELCNKKIYCGEAKGTIVSGVVSVGNPIGKAGNAIATMRYVSPNNPIGYSITAQVTSSTLNFYLRWHRESDGADAYPPDGIEVTISYMIFY